MSGALKALIDKEFGVPTRPVPNPVTNTVDATAVQLFMANPNRLGFLVVNLSANQLFIHFEPTVSSTLGILLSASGGHVAMIYKEDFHMVGYPWWCVGGGVGTDFYSLEILAERFID